MTIRQADLLDLYLNRLPCVRSARVYERTGDAVITAAYDFAAIRQARLEWGLFRDRRPGCYGAICGR